MPLLAAILAACVCLQTTTTNNNTAGKSADKQQPASCVEREMPVDVVLLFQGQNVAGKPELAAVYEGNTYHFSTAETLAAFQKQPTQFAAANGGACGRMGAMAGLGDARRFMVHDGRLYFFASDQCRDTFAKAPARFIATPDAVPTGTPQAQQEGMAIVDRWIAWAGGADAVRSAKHFVQRAEVAPTADNGHWKSESVCDIRWDGGNTTYMTVDTWTREGDKPAVHRYESGADALGSWQRTGEAAKEPLASARGAVFVQQMAHKPVVIMRARFQPGFVAVADGQGTVDGQRVDFVKVAFAGATTRLAINHQTGALVSAMYRSRDANSVVADATVQFTRMAESGGLKLPVEWSTSHVPVNSDGSTGAAASATTPKPATPVTVVVRR